MKPDHEAAKKWAKRMLTPEGLTEEEINLSRAYLDAMTRLDKAEKMRDVAYGLLDECKARLDKATELLREADVLPTFSSDHGVALRARIRAFLERKV